MTIAAKALILDFGGVISKTLFETHAETENALGLPPGTLKWRGPFDPENDSLWQSMINDEISERDYYAIRTREVGQLVGEPWTEMQQFIRAARASDPSLVLRTEALQAIETSRQAGRKLAILSNELDLFYGAEFRHKLHFLKGFDVICDATYTKVLKPDPRAYTSCLDELGLTAEECVFVDDQPRNINGAETVGLRTVLFDVQNPATGYRQALCELGLGD